MSQEKRLADAEEALAACDTAFALIPLWELSKGHTWHPSDEAIEILQKASDALHEHARRWAEGEESEVL